MTQAYILYRETTKLDHVYFDQFQVTTFALIEGLPRNHECQVQQGICDEVLAKQQKPSHICT